MRDLLLGRTSPDLDFTTDARPDRGRSRLLKAWGDAWWEVGIAFGTVGARKGDHVVEVTTYRDEVYRHDSRKPEVTFGDTLEGDLVRRDFTVNAMAVTLPGATFADPFGGLADLADRVLRTPGRPEDSFGDDPLRMMRVARFAAQLGFTVDPAVVAAMTAMADRIDIVSAERVRDELVKLVCAPDPRAGLALLVRTGLADRVLPELPEARAGDRRAPPAQGRVRAHADRARAGHRRWSPSGPDLVLRLAALMHDVGKPKTRRFETGGGVSFHHHEVVGAKLTRARLQALRFPKDVVEDVSRLVELHLRFHGYGTGAWTDAAVRRYVTDAGSAARPAAPADPLGQHDPQPAQGRGAAPDVRRPRGAHRPAARAGGARRDPARPRRQRDHGDPRRPARPGRRPGLAAPQGGAPRPGPALAPRTPRPSCAAGGPPSRTADRPAPPAMITRA